MVRRGVMINGELALEVPPRSKAVTFQIAYWTAPKSDPDGHTAPLFFREPEVDLAADSREPAPGGRCRTVCPRSPSRRRSSLREGLLQVIGAAPDFPLRRFRHWETGIHWQEEERF